MHDTHFLCCKVSLRVAQTQSHHTLHSRFTNYHSSHTRSPHSCALRLQELKDDLLDDAEWPVVMQCFNEDH